ncbi:MAG: hypothetical protein C5B54_07085 [Acidobacteria bacterium]|nr:MAG: hypothetical protein C5B54_07085 [Acidobacteriota bacterium]
MRSNRLESLLRGIRRFAFLRLLIHLFLLCIGIILIQKLTVAVAEKYLFYYPIPTFIVAGAIFLIIGVRCIGMYLRETDRFIAERLDRQFVLKDRLSTYVDLRDSNHPFLNALAENTIASTSELHLFRSSDVQRGLGLPMAITALLALVLLTLPYLPVPESISQRKEEVKQIRVEAKKMELAVTKLLQENPQAPELKALLKEMEKTARELQTPQTDKVEALKKLNALQDKLEQQREKYKNSQRESLASKLDEITKSQSSSVSLSEAEKKEAEKLARELQNETGIQDQLHSQEISKAIQDQHMSKADLEKLKKALEDYKAQKQQSEKLAAEMQKSLEQRQKGMTSGDRKITMNSRVSDRDIEKSKGGVDDGPGMTNQDIGPQHFDTKKTNAGSYEEDRTKAEYEKLYKGQRENDGKDPLFLNSEWNQSGDPQYMHIRSFGLDSNPAVTGGANGMSAQNSSESEVRKEKIPASYQGIVKKYFESIQQ